MGFLSPSALRIGMQSGDYIRLAPSLSGGAECSFVLGPIVENRRVEIGSGWPNHRVNFWIESDLGKERRIAERSEKFAFEDRLEINRPRQAIAEAQI